MKVQVISDKELSVIEVIFTSEPHQLDEDKIHSLENIIAQHQLSAETDQHTTGFTEDVGVTERTVTINDVTTDFLTDLQHWVFTGDMR